MAGEPRVTYTPYPAWHLVFCDGARSVNTEEHQGILPDGPGEVLVAFVAFVRGLAHIALSFSSKRVRYIICCTRLLLFVRLIAIWHDWPMSSKSS